MKLEDNMGWEKYLTKQFVKAENLGDKKEMEFKVTAIEDINARKDGKETDKLQLCLHLESEIGMFKFGLNQLNTNFLANSGLNTKEIVGKHIVLEKSTAFNPTIQQQVNVLKIKAIL